MFGDRSGPHPTPPNSSSCFASSGADDNRPACGRRHVQIDHMLPAAVDDRGGGLLSGGWLQPSVSTGRRGCTPSFSGRENQSVAMIALAASSKVVAVWALILPVLRDD